MKKLLLSSLISASVIMSPAVAFAHVVVQPNKVGTAAFQTFTTGVPNELDMDVTGLRLVIPAGLNYTSPNVKPGWTVETKKTGDTVTEIDWTGGTIPAGQRDDFVFSAQAPAKAGTLKWKAYQTYADGSVVAWDQTPNGKDDEDVKPYSETNVVDDLAAKPAATTTTSQNNTAATVGIVLGAAGTILGATALLTRKRS